VSAVLAAVSVLYYDGLTQNLAFMACTVALLGIIRRERPVRTAPAQRAAGP
jgi:hypothetical protein